MLHWQQRIQNAIQQKCHLPLAPASAGCCCHVAKHTPVCVHPASFALREEGGKGNPACQAGRSSQVLAVLLRRASLTCLPGTIATASHSLQTATQNTPVCAPLPWGGWELLRGRRRACGCTQPHGCVSAHGPTRAHTARGCPHPGHRKNNPDPEETSQIVLM